MTCRHGSCGAPAPDYVLVDLMGHRSWSVCSDCARALAAIGCYVISTHPGPRRAAEPSGTAPPVGGPAGARTGYEDWAPGELAEAFGR